MIPFGIFIGICFGGLVFMVYFLVGFWREGRRKFRSWQDSSVQIPAETPRSVRKARRVPDFSQASTAREVLMEEPEGDLARVKAWQVYVNPQKTRMKTAE